MWYLCRIYVRKSLRYTYEAYNIRNQDIIFDEKRRYNDGFRVSCN